KDGSKPWIWYAPTLGGNPIPNQWQWMFKQLLANGFAIGGVDVGESSGNPAGRKGYQEYYQHVVKTYGLAPKACLLPQSRGGLMLYNWAAEHAECAQCIGGIFPVCNLEGFSTLAVLASECGMTEADLRVQLREHNPIDRLDKLAQAKVPILHLH